MIQIDSINVWGYPDTHCCAIPSAFKQMDINNTVFIRASGKDTFLLEKGLRLSSIQINENLMTVMFHKAAQLDNIFSLLESIYQ